MKIYLATSNKNKKKEMQEIFSNHQIVTPSDEGIDFDPEENGDSFFANSLIKARALWEITHCPVIADDSGICVDALDGAPGIYSSRYAGPDFPKGKPNGEKIAQSEQNNFLVSQLNEALKKGIDENNGKKRGLFKNGPRSAHYTCAMVLVLDNNRFISAVETMEGTIVESIEESRGNGGFGYDPLFVLPEKGKTAAEISAEEKNAISHRGKACKIIQAAAKEIFESK